MTALLGALSGAGIAGGVVVILAALLGHGPTRLPRLRRGRLEHREALLARLGAAVLAGALVGLLTRWPVAALATLLGTLVMPRVLGGRRERQLRLARLAGVAAWAEMLRDTLTAGLGIETAIRASADVAPAAIRSEVGVLALELQGSSDLHEALRLFAARVDNPTCDRVVAALLLPRSARTLSQRLSAIAQSAQQDVEMRHRVDAEREGTRWTARLVVVITATMALGLAVLDRAYLAPYDSASGQLVLLGVAGLFAMGYAWLGRTAADPTPPRLLLRAGGGDR